MPSFEASKSGWRVTTGQAVWTPPKSDAALAGDYILAVHPDGRSLIEFTKGGLPLASVRSTSEAWRLELPGRGRTFGGRGLPPARSAWLVLARDLAMRPPPEGWQWDASRADVIAIQSTKTSERLELHLEVE